MNTFKRMIFPLLSIPFLVGCGGKSIEYCTFTFEGTNCTLQGKEQNKLKVVKGETVQYTFVPFENCTQPKLEETPKGATYEIKGNVGIFSMKMISDVTVTAASQEIAPGATYKFELNGTNCLINGDSNFTSTNPLTQLAEYTITPSSDQYGLPQLLSVKTTDESSSYNIGTDYTYTQYGNAGYIKFKETTPDGIYVTAKSYEPGVTHQVVWNFNNGNTPLIETYNDGAPLIKPADPSNYETEILDDGGQYGLTFTEWDWEGKQPSDVLPTVVDKDYTFNACYDWHSVVTKMYVSNVNAGDTISFTTNSSPKNFKINWGDGQGVVTGTETHVYETEISTPFIIYVYGDVTQISFPTSDNSDNENIYQIDLSGKITSIPDDAFKGSPIKICNIPYTVTEIGSSAFEGCANLSNVIFENKNTKLSSLSDYVFKDCSSLKSLTIPEQVSSFGEADFVGCELLSNLEVVESSTKFSSQNNCILSKDKTTLITSFENSVIPTSVSILGKYCLAERTDSLLTGIYDLPTTITKIDDFAFSGCSNLTGINFPSTTAVLTTLGQECFSKCTSINATNLIIPSCVTKVGKTIFSDCGQISYVLCEEEPGVGWDSNWNGEAKIYSNVVDAGIENNFEYAACTDEDGNLKVITCKYTGSATNITIPSTFSVDGVERPNEVIADQLFYRSLIKSVSIPSTIKIIGKEAFFLCSEITSLDLSKLTSLETIGDYAFNELSITTLTIPSKVKTIGDYAFDYCQNLATIDLSNANSLETIGNSAFSNAIITKIAIPKNVKLIGNFAFSYCSNLATIDLSNANSLETIGEQALALIETLVTVTAIPSSVKTIKDFAFAYCSNLKAIDLSNANSLETIDKGAFRGCSLIKSLFIPSSVNTIDNLAFENIENIVVDLTSFVDPESAIPSVMEYSFSSSAIFYVKDNAMLQKFQNDQEYGWGVYKNQIQIKP